MNGIVVPAAIRQRTHVQPVSIELAGRDSRAPLRRGWGVSLLLVVVIGAITISTCQRDGSSVASWREALAKVAVHDG